MAEITNISGYFRLKRAVRRISRPPAALSQLQERKPLAQGFALLTALSRSFHQSSQALAAANTQSGDTVTGVSSFHFIHQSHKQTAAGRTHRMAQSHRAAVYVDFVEIKL
jgi:hypothetical protein